MTTITLTSQIAIGFVAATANVVTPNSWKIVAASGVGIWHAVINNNPSHELRQIPRASETIVKSVVNAVGVSSLAVGAFNALKWCSGAGDFETVAQAVTHGALGIGWLFTLE